MFIEILQSPYTYLILLVALAGGYYARGKLTDAMYFVWAVPLVLLPMWFVTLLAVSLPVRLVHACFPGLEEKLEVLAAGDGPAAVSALALNPYLFAAVVTAGLFAGFCHYERRMRKETPVRPRYIGAHFAVPAGTRFHRRRRIRQRHRGHVRPRPRYLPAPRRS